jgi:O-antigen ligase
MDTFLDGLKYLAIFLVAANVVDSPIRLRRFVCALAVVSVIPAFGAISSYYRGEHLVDGDRAGWIGIFGNPNDLAYHLVIGIAMALAAASAAKSRFERLFYFSLLAPIVYALLLTQSRGGMIAAAVVGLFWLSRSFRRASLLFRIWAVGLSVGAVLMLGRPTGIFEKRTEASSYHGEDVSARGRVDAWRTGMEIARQRPLTGVGAGAFMIAWPEFAPGDAGPPRTTHNTFIQLVGELGFPALALFLTALGAGLLGAARAARTRLEPWARGIQCGLVGFAVCSLWGGLAFSWPLYLLLGAAWGAERMARKLPQTTATLPRAARYRPSMVGAA